MVHQIALGYVLGRIYWIIFKAISVLFIPFWVIFIALIFSFTYKPTPTELEQYPPVLSSSIVQESLSHLRYNFRVVFASFVPLEPELFRDISSEQKINFPKKEDAFLTKNQPIVYKELSVFIPMHQKQINDIYVKLVKYTKNHFKDKPLKNLDWNIIKN